MTIGTSSSRCNPRPRISLLGSSIGNSADLFNLVLFRHLLTPFACVLLTQIEEFLHYSSQPLFLFSWILVRLRHEMLLRRSPTVDPIQPFQRLDFFAHLLSSTSVEPLRSLSVRKFCCTSVSSSRCMSFSMRALHSSECGFVTFCAPATRVVQASHSGVGPYCATSSFRMYLRPLLWRSDDCLRYRHHYCRHWRWSHLRLFSDEHPRNSSTFSDEFIVPLLDNNRFHPNPRSHPVKKAGA